MTGPYGQIGVRLIERGYAAIAIMPGTKRPGTVDGRGRWSGLDSWQKRYAKQPPNEWEVQRWSERPDAGVGMVLGPVSRGVVCADIDTDDPDIKAALLEILPETLVGKAGQKGESLFYHAGPDFISRRFNVRGADGKLVRVLDLLGAGTQTVLPPTLHPETGKPYVWTRLHTLDDVAPEDLPEIDNSIHERIIEALKPFGYEEEREKPAARPHSDGDSPHRDLNNLAMERLADWVPALGLYRCRRARGGYEAVATWRPSSSGRPAEKRKLNLKIHPAGIKDMGTDRTYSPLDLVMEGNGQDLDDAFAWLSEKLGWASVDIVDLVASQRIEIREGVTIDSDTGEILDENPSAPPGQAGDPRDFPDEHLQVPGLVGEIADWIMATSPKPIRLFATAAALVTVGTLIGRRVYCGTPRSGAHLYVMTIAGTGAGKERPQEAVRQILDAVSSHRLYTAAAASASSLAMRLNERPVQVQIIDEVDKILRRAGHRHASSQESELIQDYCTLWGRGMGTFMPNATTTRGDMLIQRPCLSVYGATTFTSFYEQMKAKMLANGFLNRFLIMPRFERVAFNPSVQPEEVIPAGLVASARRLFEFQDVPPPGVDPRRFIGGSASLSDPSRPPEMRIIEMTPEAAALYEDCKTRDEQMLRRSDQDPMLEVWSRAAELTKRVALIVACGRYADASLHGAVVDGSDMAFARRLVDWSMTLFVTGLRENMAENDHQASVKLVLNIIRQAGEPVTRSALYRRLDGRLDARQLDGIMKLLIESEQIAEQVIKTMGRPKKLYHIVPDQAA